MWVVLEFIFLTFIVLLSVTEFFYPLLLGKPLFGSFRKKAAVVEQKQDDASLESKVFNAKGKVNEVKDVQNEVNQHFKSAEQLKAEADGLLNNSNN